MGFWEMWFWIALGDGLVFGLITRYVAKSKGYDGGFWWGFFFSLIGLLVVGFRPDNRSNDAPAQTHQAELYAAGQNSSNPPTGALPSYAGNHIKPTVSWNTWKCVCGAINNDRLDHCPMCHRTREEVIRSQSISCPHCGVVNDINRTVCYMCEKPLREEEKPVGEVNSMSVFTGVAAPKSPEREPTEPDTEAKREPEQPVQPASSLNIDMLEKLSALHEQGILTDAEFAQKKADILSRI